MRSFLKIFLLVAFSLFTLHADFLEAESAKALKEKKLILLYIESDNCPYCRKMKKEIFDEATYRKKIDEKFIFVSKKSNDPTLPAVFRTPAVPANAVLVPATKEIIDAYTGYIEPKMFMSILENAYEAKMK